MYVISAIAKDLNFEKKGRTVTDGEALNSNVEKAKSKDAKRETKFHIGNLSFKMKHMVDTEETYGRYRGNIW
mgnify:CR=1 FL=1